MRYKKSLRSRNYTILNVKELHVNDAMVVKNNSQDQWRLQALFRYKVAL